MAKRSKKQTILCVPLKSQKKSVLLQENGGIFMQIYTAKQMACNKVVLQLLAGKRNMECVSICTKIENALFYIVCHSFLSLFTMYTLDGPQQLQITHYLF